MVRALRAVSIERGRDPRLFALFAFGGSGPVHAAHLAQEMEMGRVVVPPAPGLFSSFGLLFSKLEHHYVRTFWRKFSEVALEEVNGALAQMVVEAHRELEREGYSEERVRVEATADIRYVGQNSDLGIPVPGGSLKLDSLAALREAFELEHETTYGYRSPEGPVQFVNLRIVARALRETAGGFHGLALSADRSAEVASGAASRAAYFGPALGWTDTPVVGRSGLDTIFRDGPVIIEEYDSTTVVPPRCRVRRDEWGNIVVETRRE